jgi:4-hydroxybutyrate CoA-transferase
VVTPPDKHGFCSFGANLWNKRSCARAARKVIFETDSSMIRTYGDNIIHVSEVDHFVEHTPKPITQKDFEALITDANPKRRKLLQEIFNYFTPYQRSEHLPYLLKADDAAVESYHRIFGLGELDPRLKAIAEHTKPLLRDGDTIQLGIAGISSYLPRLGVFDERADLGYHGEMTARGIGNLIKAGVINGKRKTLHRGKAVFTSLEGFGPEEMEFADENPLIELYDADYVVNIRTISSHENMVSMNSAISVDLMGQLNCEAGYHGRMINGPGGQPESHIGAIMSRGGRAITFLYSTALGGAASCIVPQFDEGAIVTVPRYFTDYVVTEHGVARLRGKSVRERAEELINIAHPDFRPELKKEASQLFYA